GGFAYAPHRGIDAASPSRDFLIAQSLQAVFELILTRSREDQVGMAVDQSGEHGLVAGVDDLRSRLHKRQVLAGANPLDLATLYDYCAVPENRRVAHRMTALDALALSGDENEFGDIAESEEFTHQ